MGRVPLWMKLLGAVALVAGACVGLAFTPTHQVAFAPHPPIDLEGRVRLDGKPTEPLQGHIALVGVTEKPVSMLQRLLLGVGDDTVDFAPEPRSGAEPTHGDAEAMVLAKDIAAAVAFRELGERVTFGGDGAVVDRVLPGSPAVGLLQPGDLIEQVNGRPVDNSVEVIDIVGRLPPGSRVRLQLRRGGVPAAPVLRTVPSRPGDTRLHSRMAVEMSTSGLEISLPRPVEINSGQVVGPSAGLAFALFIYDARSADDLLRGRFVVATGSLSVDGQVLEVGRIRQKAIAAQQAGRDILLVPQANLADARTALDDTCEKGSRCVRVVAVGSVRQAIDLLKLDDSALDQALAG